MVCYLPPPPPPPLPISFEMVTVDFVETCAGCGCLPSPEAVGTACLACKRPLWIGRLTAFAKSTHEHKDNAVILQTVGPFVMYVPTAPKPGSVYLAGFDVLCLAPFCGACGRRCMAGHRACQACGRQRGAAQRRLYDPLPAEKSLPPGRNVYMATSRATLQRAVPVAMADLAPDQCQMLSKLAAPMMAMHPPPPAAT